MNISDDFLSFHNFTTLPPQNNTLPLIYDFLQICAVRCLGAKYVYYYDVQRPPDKFYHHYRRVCKSRAQKILCTLMSGRNKIIAINLCGLKIGTLNVTAKPINAWHGQISFLPLTPIDK